MKRVVSISLGSSKRNKKSEFEILGERFELERVGTDGDIKKFASLFTELDGKVDALGIGGADLYVVAGEKRFTFREIAQCVAGAKQTPVVDGSGLKHTLERETILRLQREGTVDFKQERVILMSAVDRFGMAEALSEVCPDVVYGDLMFGLGINWPIRKHSTVVAVGKALLPIITKLPFQWFYPTGEKQDERKPKFGKAFEDRTIIAGDSLFILRYCPDRLEGKSIITQSVRSQNVEWFKSAGLKRIITTTPVVGGETFATNVMEGALVAYLGKKPSELTSKDYLELLAKMGWSPNVLELNP